jgi:hypothetical protein
LECIIKSDFLLGLKEDWKVSLDFIIQNSDNYLKILEGKYDNGSDQGKNVGSVQSRLNYRDDPIKAAKRKAELTELDRIRESGNLNI